ncbi:hypothetical protein CK203_012830 [Vitis vinifera]|uniref:Uncharacterized protein n=1 Tax=Vitis vinifera TaxID=29760 RepID=A0A438JM90_VITVI|nr:hypothetical protein CK203_012830 [Vitis vinifera]
MITELSRVLVMTVEPGKEGNNSPDMMVLLPVIEDIYFDQASLDEFIWISLYHLIIVQNLYDMQLKIMLFQAQLKVLPTIVFSSSSGISEHSNAATNILKWIFDGIKTKVMELVEKIIDKDKKKKVFKSYFL